MATEFFSVIKFTMNQGDPFDIAPVACFFRPVEKFLLIRVAAAAFEFGDLAIQFRTLHRKYE